MKLVYKIISAVLAIAILPIMVFSPLIYYYAPSLALQGLFTIAELLGSDTLTQNLEKYDMEKIPEGIGDSMSLYDVFHTANRLSGLFDGVEINEKIQTVIPAFISAAAAFILIAIIAVVTVIVAFKSKNNKSVIVSSAAGIGACWLFKTIFSDAVSPFLNGRIEITDLIDNAFAGLLADLEQLTLASTFYFIPAIFVIIILWTLVYNFTLPENEVAKKR